MNYKVTQEVLQGVLSYLAKRPYDEVFQLVAAIQASEKLVDSISKPAVSDTPKRSRGRPRKTAETPASE